MKVFYRFERDFKKLEDDAMTARFNKIVFNVFNSIKVQELWAEHEKDLYYVINSLNHSDVAYDSLKEVGLLTDRVPQPFDTKNIIEGGVYKHPKYGHCCVIKKSPGEKILIRQIMGDEHPLMIK